VRTHVYDGNADVSGYAVDDAGSMSDDPVATVQRPRIPFGFHCERVSSFTAD